MVLGLRKSVWGTEIILVESVPSWHSLAWPSSASGSTCPGYSEQAGCGLLPHPWVLWQDLGAQDPGISWRFLPSEKFKQGDFLGPCCPLESPTLIFNFYSIEMKLIELWKHPLHHPGLWVPLQNEVPTRLGLGHYDCSTQSQGLWLPQANPTAFLCDSVL